MTSEKPTLTDDVATINRDDNGDVLPESIPVTVGGQEFVVAVKPISVGQQLEYEEKHGANMDSFDETALDLIWENHVPGLDSDWRDVRTPVFYGVIKGVTGMSDVSDEVEDAIQEHEQSIEEGN